MERRLKSHTKKDNNNNNHKRLTRGCVVARGDPFELQPLGVPGVLKPVGTRVPARGKGGEGGWGALEGGSGWTRMDPVSGRSRVPPG